MRLRPLNRRIRLEKRRFIIHKIPPALLYESETFANEGRQAHHDNVILSSPKAMGPDFRLPRLGAAPRTDNAENLSIANDE